MKVCVIIESRTASNPIEMAIKQIITLNPSLQIVETPEEAELVVTNDVRKAFELLKDSDEQKVLIATLPGGEGESARAGATGLAKAYPGRVFARPMVEHEGEQNLVLFLINLTEEMK